MAADLVVAARKSPLAQAQAQIVARALEKSGVRCALKKMSSRGDEIAGPLADAGGKELFVGNLRRALLDGAADIAVHSLKDLPAEPSPEFATIAVGFAEDPRDVFVSRRRESLSAAAGATVGTCSPRRAALLREYFPRVKIAPMRGNVQTRMQKMSDGACDGLILAAAGLRRLNLIGNAESGDGANGGELHFDFLPPDTFIPAPGQGLLAVECAAKNLPDGAAAAAYRALSGMEAESAHRCAVESEFVRAIGGDCHTPLGAFARADGDNICLRAFYAGGGRFRKTAAVFSRADKDAARAVAEALLRQ